MTRDYILRCVLFRDIQQGHQWQLEVMSGMGLCSLQREVCNSAIVIHDINIVDPVVHGLPLIVCVNC